MFNGFGLLLVFFAQFYKYLLIQYADAFLIALYVSGL
jgi:hypothetical protein